MYSIDFNIHTTLLCHLCGHKYVDEQVNQPRHRHVPTTVQKRVFERFILGLNPVVCVVVQLPPHTECLDPHLQINKKKQFLLLSRRTIYTLGHHDTSLYLLFRSPLIGVIIPKVRGIATTHATFAGPSTLWCTHLPFSRHPPLSEVPYSTFDSC